MLDEVLAAVGGLGLFLLGMIVLTEGLRGLAGRSLRHLLSRFTRTPLSGAMTGAAVTALVQSSSATIVTAVGFVGAGLLTFAQALGIIFGANIGTTITGWMVALIGFKFDLAVAVMPLVMIGVLLRLFGRGRARHAGWAMVGFAVLFLGIASMQSGMEALEGVVTPTDFPDDSLAGRLQLVMIGIVITLVTQSSSAGIATALVALGAGTISFPQAAAMVIGMDIGTTVTAALATLGGGSATRRTGFAHVIYNILTGIVAFLLLNPYVTWVAPWIDSGMQGDPQIALVAFHTTFNLLGVLLILPFTHFFARFIVWLVPDKGPASAARLDDRLLKDADAAIDAAMQTLSELSLHAFTLFRRQLDGAAVEPQAYTELREGLDVTGAYLERIRTDPANVRAHPRHQASIHTHDHLSRLAMRLENAPPVAPLVQDDDLRPEIEQLAQTLASEALPLAPSQERKLQRSSDRLRQRHHPFREETIEMAARSEASGKAVLARLDAYRWLLRCTRHAQRIAFHLSEVAKEHTEGSDLEDGVKIAP